MSRRCPHCLGELPWVVDAFCPSCRQRLDEPPTGAPAEPPPTTTVVDLPFASSPWYVVTGVLLTAGGLLLRVFSRWLAWPAEWQYTGERANTRWAYNEALYIDLGLVLLAFGLALVYLGIMRKTDPKRPTHG